MSNAMEEEITPWNFYVGEYEVLRGQSDTISNKKKILDPHQQVSDISEQRSVKENVENAGQEFLIKKLKYEAYEKEQVCVRNCNIYFQGRVRVLIMYIDQMSQY